MAREIIPICPLDPEILEARDITKKLLREFYACQDPLTKDALKAMAWNEIDHERELRRKSQAREAVKMLHNLQNPVINVN